MTVAIGLVCLDGVVVAADSLSSSGGVARQGQKVRALSTLPVAWTSSGSVYVIEDVEMALNELDALAAETVEIKESFVKPNLPVVRQNLAQYVRGAMTKCYKSLMPGYQMVPTVAGPKHPWASDFLIVGYSDKTPYFLEIADDGQLNWHTEARFYAVGSGGEFAAVTEALMAHYVEGGDLTVDMGLQVAARAIETTCRVSSAHVRGPVQLAVVDEAGARVLDQSDVDQVMHGVEAWLELEKDTLQTSIAPAVEIENPPEYEESNPKGDSD